MKKWFLFLFFCSPVFAQESYIYLTRGHRDVVNWEEKVGRPVKIETELTASLRYLNHDNMVDLGLSDDERDNWYKFRALGLNYLFCLRELIDSFRDLYEGDIVVIEGYVARLYTRGPGFNTQPMIIVEHIYRVNPTKEESDVIVPEMIKRPKQSMLEYVTGEHESR